MRRQIVPWFGSKAALAAEILPEFGPHVSYFEPFGGGLGMLLQKPVVRAETVNDLHQDLTNLARVLADERLSRQLQRAIDRRACCEQLHREARQRLAEPFEPGLARAVDFFFASWMAMSGMVGTKSCRTMAHGYGVNAHSCASKLRGAAASIASFHHRLKSVTITNRDGFTLLAKIQDQPGLLIYCDPPYVSKNGTYIHDFAAVDHQRLAEALRRFRQTRVLVSYTDHPLLDELYRGWQKKVLDYQPRADRHAKVRSTKPPEILLCNGASFQPRRKNCQPITSLAV